MRGFLLIILLATACGPISYRPHYSWGMTYRFNGRPITVYTVDEHECLSLQAKAYLRGYRVIRECFSLY
jgi:hypothetical protein